MSEVPVTPDENTEDDLWEFRCMYCNSDMLVYYPFVLETEPYPVDTPEGEIWLEEREEEGYLCQDCGSHCGTEEVYWWHPDHDESEEDAP